MHNPITQFIPASIFDRFEVHNIRHAAELLATAWPTEYRELIGALDEFQLTLADISKPGGNESDIHKMLDSTLYRLDWREARIRGDLHISIETYAGKRKIGNEKIRRENFLDGHKVDFVKNGVAFDFEWNSKDQTFDRDLYALRAFHECGLIGAGVILTRSAELNPIFDQLGKVRSSSTTWMGKLLYRLHAGRAGSCPVLALGITPRTVSDWRL